VFGHVPHLVTVQSVFWLPRMEAAAELRARIAQKAAKNRQLRQENQKLQSELRRANSEAVIVERLHHAHIAGHGRTSAPSRAGTAEGFSWNTSPASFGSNTPEATMANQEDSLHLRLAEAEAAAERAADDVEALKACLCSDKELDSLKSEAIKIQVLVERQCKASPADLEVTDLSRLRLPEEADEDATEGDTSVIRSDCSFEMLSTVGEVARAETKKALEVRIAALSRELRSLEAASHLHAPAAATTVADRRRQRRLQQADTLAAGLHGELRRHAGSGVTSPQSRAGSSVREVFGGASNISPHSLRSSLPSGPSGTVTPSYVSSAGKASTASRISRLDKGIKEFSKRFTMRATLR